MSIPGSFRVRFAIFAFVMSVCAECMAAPLELLADADSYIRSGQYADDNYGTISSLVVKTAGTDYDRHTYIRYLLPAGLPTLDTAELRLQVANNFHDNGVTPVVRTLRVFGLSDSSAGQDWGETSITWNTAPGLLGGHPDASETTDLGTITVPAIDCRQNTVIISLRNRQ